MTAWPVLAHWECLAMIVWPILAHWKCLAMIVWPILAHWKCLATIVWPILAHWKCLAMIVWPILAQWKCLAMIVWPILALWKCLAMIVWPTGNVLQWLYGPFWPTGNVLQWLYGPSWPTGNVLWLYGPPGLLEMCLSMTAWPADCMVMLLCFHFCPTHNTFYWEISVSWLNWCFYRHAMATTVFEQWFLKASLPIFTNFPEKWLMTDDIWVFMNGNSDNDNDEISEAFTLQRKWTPISTIHGKWRWGVGKKEKLQPSTVCLPGTHMFKGTPPPPTPFQQVLQRTGKAVVPITQQYHPPVQTVRFSKLW